MSDYGFVHEGMVFTPDRSVVALETNEERNKAIEAAELKYWQTGPDQMLAYYDDKAGTVSTWLGTKLGTITKANVYRHNFGHRMISLRVIGTNGADYYGRASYDWGSCVILRRVK